MSTTQFWINGEPVGAGRYSGYHDRRMTQTLATLRKMGARRIVEMGGHPWVMTSHLVNSGMEVCATISAEEVTKWADDIGVTRQPYHLKTAQGREANFSNYSANLERRLFDITETPDTVLACEIIEHCIRAPHVLLLNANHWLPVGGKLLLSTPNGAQFSNPFRRRSPTPAFRCHLYERHEYLFTLEELVDLVSLCGFKVTDAGYWDVYERSGPSSVYGWLAKVPLGYMQDKFQKTIYLAAEKQVTASELPRAPRIYIPHPEWEFIAPPGKS